MKYQVKDMPISIEAGVISNPGDVIELKEEDAKELVEAGLVIVAEEAPSKTKEAK